MPMQDLKAIDNKDDKRQIKRLLEFMTPEERVRFLNFCAYHTNNVLKQSGLQNRIKFENKTGTTEETYLDILMLVTQWDFPVPFLLENLEHVVRQKQKTGQFPEGPK